MHVFLKEIFCFKSSLQKTLAPTKSVSGPDILTSSALPGDQDPDVSPGSLNSGSARDWTTLRVTGRDSQSERPPMAMETGGVIWRVGASFWELTGFIAASDPAHYSGYCVTNEQRGSAFCR
ncbi:hypothetical protein CDAR_411071 [Caerostris darwini]|uniref:Uncharacterized protein n=1 Tax=Caerostris darwini TaxID=1538125 RepID=A0AAV4SDD6_9ARAC|nr:hypothetical protein CDAR_411071 [Caerostris darwini]